MANKTKAKLVLIPGKKHSPNCWIQICKLLPHDEEPRHVLDEEIQELEADTSAESEKGSNNDEPRCLSAEKTKELDTSTYTEEEYPWMFLCYWNFFTEKFLQCHV